MADMTDISGHSYGRRPTRIMSTGWDGNFGINQLGGKNVRTESEIIFGEDGTGDHRFEAECYYDNDENEDRQQSVPPWMRD